MHASPTNQLDLTLDHPRRPVRDSWGGGREGASSSPVWRGERPLLIFWPPRCLFTGTTYQRLIVCPCVPRVCPGSPGERCHLKHKAAVTCCSPPTSVTNEPKQRCTAMPCVAPCALLYRTAQARRGSTGTPRCLFTGTRCPCEKGTGTEPVKRHRGEQWGSRDTHGTHGHTDHTDEPHNQPIPPTHGRPVAAHTPYSTCTANPVQYMYRLTDR